MSHPSSSCGGAGRALALISLVVVLAACSGSPDSTATPPTADSTPEQTVATQSTETVATESTEVVELDPATFTVQPGTEQVTVLGAAPGTELSLIDGVATPGGDLPSQAVVASGDVDEQGSLVFRAVAPGEYRLASATESSDVFVVADRTEVPPASLYEDQPLLPAGGFGYITTRDGTTLSANVVLPGPADQGPYPTVVEYSGYAPSNPDDATFAGIYGALGFAYVGVNMRGSGCSGGSFGYFEHVQSLDGYDVVEAVAAQPWVAGNRVGMVGISYPGISQLFVAATQPPSLAAITPLSVLDDVYGSTLYPGGLLNTGFAVQWSEERAGQAEPYGQAWTRERADAGDQMCADNQLVRLQNPDQAAAIAENEFYTPETSDALAPRTFVDQIEVPVFIAGAWQDEQTGGRFATMLDRFTGAPDVFITLMNGLHTESLSPGVLQRYVEFLQLYVAEQVPDVAPANTIASILVPAVFGVESTTTFDNRFDGMTLEEALAAFEDEPSVRLLVEQGGSADTVPGAPVANFIVEQGAWPIPDAVATSWYLGDGGTLTTEPPAAVGTDDYLADPAAVAATFHDDVDNPIWNADVTWDWPALADGTGLGFATEPFADDTFVAGSGSVDLWVGSSSGDTDLEVTVTEVRPDGTEIYVQSGWLRASQRALDDEASTDLRPVQTHLEADAAPLDDGELTLARVEVFPFAHPFRAGSRLRLTVDAPGGNRPVWAFDTTISDGETVTVGHGGETASRIVLAVVPGVDIADHTPPACGALRGQPCRTWVAAANGG
jgi:predicted acyl esterase